MFNAVSKGRYSHLINILFFITETFLKAGEKNSTKYSQCLQAVGKVLCSHILL